MTFPTTDAIHGGEEQPSSPIFLAVASAEAKRLLGECMDGLPARQRRLIVLRYRDDLTMAQIAVRFCVTPAAVCRMHQRTLTSLSGMLAARNIRRLSDLI